ncbi:MAG: hypothetical protein GX862_07305 [Leucobacter sp.]|jgi:hypothetical protein|nr:hypothetical protein [Leucobacter sp.]
MAWETINENVTQQSDLTQQELEHALREWARGVYSQMAGVELLIKHGRAVYPRAPWIGTDTQGFAWIDCESLITESGAYSGGERRLFAIAASLIDGLSIRLNDAVTGLDHANARLVLDAIATAAGFAEPTISFERDPQAPPRS